MKRHLTRKQPASSTLPQPSGKENRSGEQQGGVSPRRAQGGNQPLRVGIGGKAIPVGHQHRQGLGRQFGRSLVKTVLPLDIHPGGPNQSLEKTLFLSPGAQPSVFEDLVHLEMQAKIPKNQPLPYHIVRPLSDLVEKLFVAFQPESDIRHLLGPGVGGKKPVPLNIRIIATSNRDMAEAVAKGVFREDLFYRLNVFPVAIPALRQRREDIPAIARHFVVEHGGRLGRSGVSLTPAAEALLLAHQWPGNVRELENVIQRALILSTGPNVGPEHFNLCSGAKHLAEPAPTVLAHQAGLPDVGNNADNMKNLEREHILRTFAELGGSRKRTIERLGISERTLRYKLQQYRDEGYFKG